MLRLGLPAAAFDNLLSGRIDLGLLRPPLRRAELDSLRVQQERFVVCSHSSILDADRPQRLADFSGLPVIMYAPDKARYFHDLLTAEFYAQGVSPQYVQYVSQIHSILALVGVGLGCALVPESARSLHFDGVRYSSLQGEATPEVELILCYRKDNDSPAVARLAALVAE